jgi:hypothetical protein
VIGNGAAVLRFGIVHFSFQRLKQRVFPVNRPRVRLCHHSRGFSELVGFGFAHDEEPSRGYQLIVLFRSRMFLHASAPQITKPSFVRGDLRLFRLR